MVWSEILQTHMKCIRNFVCAECPQFRDPVNVLGCVWEQTFTTKILFSSLRETFGLNLAIYSPVI
jgi:hypothetical protein